MDQFQKVRKKMSIAESTRQVLNKSIDLLHKLSNKKLSKEEIKEQISELLSGYFLAIYPDGAKRSIDEIDEPNRMKLELFLEQAYDIVDKVSGGKAPLYEAIMLMNKVVVANQPVIEEERLSQEKPVVENRIKVEEDPGLVPDEFDLSGEAKEKIKMRGAIHQKNASSQNVGTLISDVLKKQEELHQSIFTLNDSLKTVGFELRAISKERP